MKLRIVKAIGDWCRLVGGMLAGMACVRTYHYDHRLALLVVIAAVLSFFGGFTAGLE